MYLKDILSILPFYEVSSEIKHININSIEIDHRKARPGALFVCIKGFTVDGHDFAEKAVENGACVIIAEKRINVPVPVIIVKDTTRSLAMVTAKFFDFPSNQLTLIGITGTNGKTTITYLLEAIFKGYHQKTGLIGTIQMKINEDEFPVKNTTPNALDLQKNLKAMVEQQVDVVMMEVSSHALDLGRVYGCHFDVAVYTNLSQDHLDYHKNIDNYLRAKSLLFAQLGNDYSNSNPKFAVINADDSYSDYMYRSTGQHIISYGIHMESDVMAKNIQLSANKTKFILKTPIGSIAIQSNLIGMFNIYNMLTAASVAITQNIPLTIIKMALENIDGVSGRFEQVIAGQSFATIVDYAHTPDSLENVLQTIQEFSKHNIYVVVGCGGDRDRSKRPLMAEVALKYADLAIFTTDNPRTEAPTDILGDMINGLVQTHYEVIVDREQAIYRAVDLASDDDIILIAGKGHETYQEINYVKYDFDDRIIARKAIEAKENK